MAGHREAALDAQVGVLLGLPSAAVHEDGRRAAALVIAPGRRVDVRGRVAAQRDEVHREQPFLAQSLVVRVLHDAQFRIEQRRVPCPGIHPRLHILPIGLPIRVREAVAVPRRGGREADELGRGEEIFVISSEVEKSLRKRALDGRLQHDLERRSVAPVVVAFRIPAALVGLEGQLVGFQGLLEHRPAEVRVLLPHGEGAVHHAGVAHGVPVDFAPVEPRIGLVPGRFEAFVDDRPRHGLPLGRRHPAVQPVIADGEGHRHLAHVQEMRGIPVGERAGGQHLVDGPPRVRLPAMDPVGISEPKDAFEGGPGGMQQAPADERSRHRRLRQRRVAERDDEAVGLREHAARPPGRLFPRPHQQPRVRHGLLRPSEGHHPEQHPGKE